MNILITGSFGLVGLSASKYFLNIGHTVIGIDNNMRSNFFGTDGSTNKNLKILSKFDSYKHFNIDIVDSEKIENLFKEEKIDVVIHTAAQPSHDKATQIPKLDFSINALGTLNLLEAVRHYAPNAVFIFTSTNKVYGDNPNNIEFVESKTRFDFKDSTYLGFNETLSIDHCLHSLFGVSKTAADLYVQEYGKYFGIKTTAIRLGCITGSLHSGVKLHGFLSYLIKSLVHSQSYEIIGYKGKQVRDQIHADDLVFAFEQIIKNPKKGEAYNLGGGRENSVSVLELIDIISKKLKIKPKISYNDQVRKGDHICYISDYSKFKKQYPKWEITKSLDQIIEEIIVFELKKK